MFPSCKFYGQIKFSIFFVLFIVSNNNVMTVTKRQITIGQYFFPRTASFPDYGWNADVHHVAEPIYDEIILLPQEKQQHQNVVGQEKGRLYPIPTRIFRKNRFNSPRAIKLTEQPLFFDKKTGKYAIGDDTNVTYIAVPRDGVMTDVRIKMSVDDSDDIQATIINETPGTRMKEDRRYRFGGYGGRVVVDLTSDNSSEAMRMQSSLRSNRMQQSSKFPKTLMNALLSQACGQQLRTRSFRSNTEIFNQILKVRKDINGLRNDIRQVKELVEEMNSNKRTPGYDFIAQQTGGTTRRGDNENVDFRSFHKFPPKVIPDNRTAEPVYVVTSRTISTTNPLVRFRMRANAEAPLMLWKELKGDEIEHNNSLRNSTMLPVRAAEGVFLDSGSAMEFSQKKKLLKILSVKTQSGGNARLHAANESSDMVKLSSAD